MKKQQNKLQTIDVGLQGTTDIMFDRYSGDNKTDLTVKEKMYLGEKGKLVFPAANILSFLCAINTDSAAKRFYDNREYKRKAASILSNVGISPNLTPFTDGKNEIFFKDFENGPFYIHESVARLPKGIPNPKSRPCLKIPWELNFQIHLLENSEIKEEDLYRLFELGGMTIGLGTYRGVYGKFSIKKWEVK